MNRILILLSLVCLLSHCSQRKSRDKIMDISVDVLGKLPSENFRHSKKGETFYSVKIDMLNNSDSVISFWTLSCNWEMNWRYDAKWLYLYNGGCDHDNVILKQIEPDQKLSYEGVLCVTDSLRDTNNIKLGFVYKSKKEVRDYYNADFTKTGLRKQEEKKDIIWSEPFKIK